MNHRAKAKGSRIIFATHAILRWARRSWTQLTVRTPFNRRKHSVTETKKSVSVSSKLLAYLQMVGNNPNSLPLLYCPMFEDKVFREQLCCIDESTCVSVGLFGTPPVVRRVGHCTPLPFSVRPWMLIWQICFQDFHKLAQTCGWSGSDCQIVVSRGLQMFFLCVVGFV